MLNSFRGAKHSVVVLRLPIKVQTRLFNLFLLLSRTKECFSANFANNLAKTKNYHHRMNPQEKLILIGAVRQETHGEHGTTRLTKEFKRFDCYGMFFIQ